MRIVICDDELFIREQIEKYLTEYFKKHNLVQPEYASFCNGEELLKDNAKVDIAFLDVEMPGRSGTQIGKELKARNPNCLVFIVTSYMEYLDEAMEFRVFRYLSKPIDKNRLFRNMNQAIEQYGTTSRKAHIETKTGVKILPEMDIVCVEAESKKIYIYTKDKKYESTQKMQYWIETLDAGCFFQTHRSYIVNMKYVSAYDETMVYLCAGNIKAYLTRRKYKQFKNRHIMFLEKMG